MGTDVRFGSKADMCSALGNVRFVPQADIPRPLTDASDVSNRLIAWQELKLPFN